MAAPWRPSVVVAVLMVLHGAVTITAFAFTDVTRGGFVGMLPLFVGFACGASQAVLVASWLTLGGGTLLGRSLLALGAGFGMACLYGACVVLPAYGWAEFTIWMTAIDACVIAPFAAAAIAGTAARLGGWRWTRDESSPTATVRFSLGELLGAIVFAALCLAAARWLQTHAEDVRTALVATLDGIGFASGAYPTFLLVGASFLAPSLAAVVVALDRRPRVVFVAGATVAVLLVGVVAWLATTASLRGDFAAVSAVGAAVASTLTLLSILALRGAGWRLEREATLATPDAPALVAPTPDPLA